METVTTLGVPEPAPRIARFERLGFGLFLHWGLYSQLGRGEWVQHIENIPVPEYEKLKNTFTARDFEPRAIARLAKEAGMRYVSLTTRHHEGFSLYDTRGLSDFDALHSPAGRDLVAEFVDGCRAEGIVPFFYHTTLDWRWNSADCSADKFAEYLDYLHASVELLCRQYGPIGGFFFDGNWSRPDADWKEDRLYAMMRRWQPETMIINNTGLSARGQTGHAEIDSVTFEQGLPQKRDQRGWPKYVAGEMCQTLNGHWGVGVRDFRFLSVAQIIETFCACRNAGANYLLNAGPSAQGGIPALEAALLRKTGEWMALMGPVLYEGKPAGVTCQGRDFMLRQEDRLYYFAYDLSGTGDEHVTLGGGGAGPRALDGVPGRILSGRWLDSGEDVKFTQDGSLAALVCPGYPYGTDLVVRVAELACTQ